VLVGVASGAPRDPRLDAALASLDTSRDRAFCAELVRGTLQWQGRYDHLLRRFARKRPPTDPGLLAVLRMSAHQLVGQDGVPPYAAIHQAGELCRTLKGGARATGFVNGMLQAMRRRLLGDGDGPAAPAERDARLRAEFAGLEPDRAAWIAAWHSLPRWLVDRWLRAFGAEATAALAAWLNEPVPVAFHVLEPGDPAVLAADLREAGYAVDPGPAPRSVVCRDRPARERVRRMLERFPGLIVQDPTVQRATAWLLEAVDPESAAARLPAVDLCAAPGGKTAVLAARWRGPVLAMDASRRRLPLLADTTGRLVRPPAGLARADAARPPVAPGSCGAVLLDGPCSGTGVLRHHPDGRWRLRPAVIAERAARLAVLARRAADLLAPGGVLMYGTCSLEDEENGAVVEGLLRERDDLEPAPDPDGRWRRLWLPHEAGGDGFFAARVRRKVAR
jgi:16S rRNA (cytosine967-C5)-methyltransferase